MRYLKQLLAAADRAGSLNFDLGSIDESFDSHADRAVRQYQQVWMQVEADGVVTSAVWAALEAQAGTYEMADDAARDLTGATEARREVGGGNEVGDRGWRQVDVDIEVYTPLGRPFPDSTAYVQVADKDGTTSDVAARVEQGVVRLRDIWLPVEEGAHLYLHVDSWQPGPGGRLGNVTGFSRLTCKSGLLHFVARQQEGVEGSISREEAEAKGWTHGTQVSAGIDLEVVNGGETTSIEESTEHSSATSQTLTVRYPGAGFLIEQS